MVNKLHSLNLDEVGPIVDFINSVKELQMQLHRVGEVIFKSITVQIVLDALPNNYESFVQSIVTLDELPFFEKKKLASSSLMKLVRLNLQKAVVKRHQCQELKKVLSISHQGSIQVKAP